MELRKARESIKLDDMILTPNKGRSWKAYASQLHPDPNFGDIGKGVSAFRLPATKSRRGPPPPEFLQIDSRVWSKL